jgi:dihydroorotate dehydrogenase (NAD+) catalytic subunit
MSIQGAFPMEIVVCGIRFRNPVLAASGTFGYGIEFEKLVDLDALGGIVVKGLSKDPIQGNPAPRLWEARAGMINSVGLQNVGVRAFIADKLPRLRRYSTPVIANVFGYAAEDYVEVVHALNDAEGIAAYELNVSCPNTERGGLSFGVDELALADLIERVKSTARLPVIVKLSPNVTSIEPFAMVAEQNGADAISLVNTFVSLAIDAQWSKRRGPSGYPSLELAALPPARTPPSF